MTSSAQRELVHHCGICDLAAKHPLMVMRS